MEVGTYCGKSTVHFGVAARKVGAQLITLDHHRGSEENQPGWEWHDTTLVDPHTGRLETLPSLRRTLLDAGLDDVVTAIVGSTQQVGRWWSSPLTFLFLDGNHTEEVAQHDYAAFAPHVVVGGVLARARRVPRPGRRRPAAVERRAACHRHGCVRAGRRHGLAARAPGPVTEAAALAAALLSDDPRGGLAGLTLTDPSLRAVREAAEALLGPVRLRRDSEAARLLLAVGAHPGRSAAELCES